MDARTHVRTHAYTITHMHICPHIRTHTLPVFLSHLHKHTPAAAALWSAYYAHALLPGVTAAAPPAPLGLPPSLPRPCAGAAPAHTAAAHLAPGACHIHKCVHHAHECVRVCGRVCAWPQPLISLCWPVCTRSMQLCTSMQSQCCCSPPMCI